MDKATQKGIRRMFKRAVMATTNLTPTERLVAFIYEEFAGAGVRDVWVTTDALVEASGLARSSAIRLRASLVAKGWLVETAPATPRTAAKYALTIPDGEGAVYVPADAEPGDVKMIPGALVEHGGPAHRVPESRGNVTTFRRRTDAPTPTPTWDPNAPECDADGSLLRRDGSCPICSRLSAVAR